ncbi:hypothetical protein MOQ_001649, partial [Trypanosoma cruzi marinkellei]
MPPPLFLSSASANGAASFWSFSCRDQKPPPVAALPLVCARNITGERKSSIIAFVVIIFFSSLFRVPPMAPASLGSWEDKVEGERFVGGGDSLPRRLGHLRNALEGAKHPVPQRNVLTVVVLELQMVQVMGPDVEDVGNVQINAGVIEASQCATNKDKDHSCQCVHLAHGCDAAEKVQGKKMQVLTGDVLKRVDVDGVVDTAKRRHLAVVVLVDERVNGRPVQRPVEEGVEKVVDKKQRHEVQRHPRHGAKNCRPVHKVHAHAAHVGVDNKLVCVVHKEGRDDFGEVD